MRILTLLLFSFFGVAVSGQESKILELTTPFAGSKLFVPSDGKAHPGVLILHGSEGGSLPYYQLEAQFLAAHGYAALAYCWYNCGKNPLTSAIDPLENVSLDATYGALTWLKESEHVRGKKVAISGTSRGAEEALLLGWLTTRDKLIAPDAIAVHAPSDVVVTGFTWAAMDKRCWVCDGFGLDCFQGSENPLAWDWAKTHWNKACGKAPKNPATELIPAWRWKGIPLLADARIEIESYRGPLFIAHGTKDELWGHDRTLRIRKTLEASGASPEVHLFEGEKHVFSSRSENQKKEWLLEFLGRSLK